MKVPGIILCYILSNIHLHFLNLRLIAKNIQWTMTEKSDILSCFSESKTSLILAGWPPVGSIFLLWGIVKKNNHHHRLWIVFISIVLFWIYLHNATAESTAAPSVQEIVLLKVIESRLFRGGEGATKGSKKHSNAGLKATSHSHYSFLRIFHLWNSGISWYLQSMCFLRWSFVDVRRRPSKASADGSLRESNFELSVVNYRDCAYFR